MAHHAQKPDEAGEGELLALARQKDEAAVRTLIRRHNRRLFRIARSVVRDDAEAEDVLQEAYVRAFTHLSEFRAESSFATWVSRIVLNEALGRLRRRRRTGDWVSIETLAPSAEIIPFPLASNSPDPERNMAQREIRTLLEQAIDGLPEAFRTVLVARVIEEMSIEETAELLGLRPETVKTRLHRARRLLRDALERQVGPVMLDAFPFDGARCQRMADVVVARLALKI
jgi:RNA polymerase sigma-70 factor (ECF subfamily)